MNLFVGNLSPEATVEDLRKLFSEFGEIVEVKVLIDPATGLPRGFGFVEIADKYHSYDAMDNLDATYFMGQVISVKEAKGGKQPARGGGGGRRPGGGGGFNKRPGGGGGYNSDRNFNSNRSFNSDRNSGGERNYNSDRNFNRADDRGNSSGGERNFNRTDDRGDRKPGLQPQERKRFSPREGGYNNNRDRDFNKS